MAEVVFDGVGTPVIDPNISGAEVNFTSGLVIFTNALNPREVEFDGVGVPVADANRPPTNPVSFDNRSKNVVLGAAAAIFPAPATEIFFDGIGTPVALGNSPGFPNNFDNRGRNVSFGATNAIFPSISTLGTAGIPVGDGNQPNNPVTFDNRGKNVVITPALGPPIGTILYKEVTFVTGRVLDIGNGPTD